MTNIYQHKPNASGEPCYCTRSFIRYAHPSPEMSPGERKVRRKLTKLVGEDWEARLLNICRGKDCMHQPFSIQKLLDEHGNDINRIARTYQRFIAQHEPSELETLILNAIQKQNKYRGKR